MRVWFDVKTRLALKQYKHNNMVESLEEQRLANIRRNQELLRQLELEGMADQMEGDVRHKSDKKAAAKKRSQSKVKKEVENLPRRKSRRLEGLKAEFEPNKELDERLWMAKQEEDEQARTRKEGEMKLQDILKSGKGWENMFDVLQTVGTKASQGDYFDAALNGRNNGKDNDLAAKRKELSGLQLWDKFSPNELRLTSERIISMGFHPSIEKKLVMAGDKVGELGLWDADTAREGDEGEDEPQIMSLKVHSRAISAIAVDPSNTQRVYTSSYDGSIRCLDLATQTSIEAYVHDSDPRHPVGISDISLIDPATIYFSTLEGGFGIRDLRAKKSPHATKELLQLCEKKIGGFAVNPNASYQIATASLDRSLKLWDLRAVSNVRATDDMPAHRTAHLYGAYPSRLSVSCASWNRSGSIVVNGYDDTINVFDVRSSADWKQTTNLGELKPNVRIKHNCQTGRWVSILKSVWHRSPTDSVEKFAIGNMKRYIDIYAANGTQLAHLGDELMTAVPAVVQFHPSQNWVVGGTASGRPFLFV
jgi:WD40 repeat protein